MCYKKLAEEYLKESEILKTHIKKIKKYYYYKNDTDERDNYYRLKTLYSMYLDLKHIGEYLIEKYGGENDGEKSYF